MQGLEISPFVRCQGSEKCLGAYFSFTAAAATYYHLVWACVSPSGQQSG
jgi:hypothetical protein